MKMRFALAGIAMAAAAPFAHAEEVPYFGLQGTYLFPDSARNNEDGLGGTILFGFPVTQYFAPEINLYGLRAEHDGAPGSDKQWGGGLDFAVYPFGRGWVSPFLLLGGGAQYEDRDINSGTNGFANAGGGFLINLNQSGSAAIRIDAKRYWIWDDEVEAGRDYVMDTRINAGVQLAFGRNEPPPPPPPPPPPADSDGDGVPDPLDPCPNTPRGVPVDTKGCPLPPPPPPPPKDSDGDGVLDNVDACPNTPAGMRVDSRGCAIKAATVVLRDINFEFNSSKLSGTSQDSLDKIVEGLRGQPSMNLIIEGHTDAVGTDAYNLKLSQLRAASARSYLISKGIDASRLQTRGYGESRPVASNKDPEGRAQNRRVEFKVTKE